MWLLILVIYTLTPDDRVKAIDVTTQLFAWEASCEKAAGHIKRMVDSRTRQQKIDYECIKK